MAAAATTFTWIPRMWARAPAPCEAASRRDIDTPPAREEATQSREDSQTDGHMKQRLAHLHSHNRATMAECAERDVKPPRWEACRTAQTLSFIFSHFYFWNKVQIKYAPTFDSTLGHPREDVAHNTEAQTITAIEPLVGLTV
jgi:hypothetical protein